MSNIKWHLIFKVVGGGGADGGSVSVGFSVAVGSVGVVNVAAANVVVVVAIFGGVVIVVVVVRLVVVVVVELDRKILRRYVI